MERKLRRLGRPLFESALIVFSVLFALYVNRWAENQRTERQKDIALSRIVQELEGNRVIIEKALQTHRDVVANLRKASADENDSLRFYLVRDRHFSGKVFQFLANGKSFYKQFPSSTSWSSAKSTGIIAEFDYPVLEALTKVYDTQAFFMQETLPTIAQSLYVPVSDNELDTINPLNLRMNELIAQEATTLDRINEALEVIGREKPGAGL